MSQDCYFYGDAQQQERGPYSAAQMRALAMNGTLTMDAPVYQSGTGEWRTLADFPDLMDVAPAPPQPSSPHHAQREHRRCGIGGVALQWIGVLAIIGVVVTPWSLLVGLVLFVVGYILAWKWQCTACGNGVTPNSGECPTCRAQLTAGGDRSATDIAAVVVIVVVAGVVAAVKDAADKRMKTDEELAKTDRENAELIKKWQRTARGE